MPSGSESQPPIPGMLLIALVLGTLFFIEPPLEGSRPKEPSSISDLPSSEQVIPARLWQDPFEAIALYRSPGKSASNLPGKAKLQPAADKPDRPQCTRDLKAIRPPTEKHPFGALLVMTPVTQYVEDRERRMRARYAVISALGVTGLSPRDNQHIGCHRFVFATQDKQTDTSGEFDMPFEWFVPPDFDPGDEKTRPSVLVAWLPEERFSRAPLEKLNDIVGQLRSTASGEVSVAVVGPQKSGTLNIMRRELRYSWHDPKAPEMHDVKFYSPSATMDECDLLREKTRSRGKTANQSCESFSELYTKGVYNARGEGFIRTIVSDSEISEALVNELELRGLEFDLSRRNWVKQNWFELTESLFQDTKQKDVGKEIDSSEPSWVKKHWLKLTEYFFQDARKDGDTNCTVFSGHRDHVVLISELDTLYGRRFPEAFIHAASSHDPHSTPELSMDRESFAASEKDTFRWIHRFGYLRGLDGQVPAMIREGTPSAPTRRKIAPGKEGSEAQSNIERAASTPRFDYLRRLTHRIERLDDKLRKHYCGSVKAIGILGSDVYDKLLILQALRERFPNTLFFTADMDARYLHPAEFKWTRNLIVASSHGLEPDVAFETNIPPFRDSYQTSRFLATLFALSKVRRTKCDIESVLMPHVFEIGRTAARDLTNTKDRSDKAPTDTDACHQAETKDSSGVKNRDTAAPKQKPWMLADLFLDSEQNHRQDNRHDNDQGPGDTDFASVEIDPGESYLQVHTVRAEYRFDRLLEDNSPGLFIITGTLLATILAGLGVGYYVLNYFGLHPLKFMHDNWDSSMPPKPEIEVDVHLIVVTAILWLTLLLVGLSNLVVFLLLGAVIILLILVGRASRAVQDWLLEFLQVKRLPVKVALLLLVGALFWAVHSYFQEVSWPPFALGVGEPFSLSDGISMWPGEALRILAGGLSIIFMVVGWMSLKTGDKELSKEFFPSVTPEDIKTSTKCARARRIDWCSPKNMDAPHFKNTKSPNNECTPPFSAETNWMHYRVYRTLPERWNSVLFPATLFFLLGCISIYWLDDLHVPYRGEFIYRLDHVAVFGFMVPAFLLLLFAVIDETSLCVGWIRSLAKFTERTETSSVLLGRHDKKDDQSEADQELDRIWVHLKIVARRTRRVNKLIIYPFVVLFLILVSQSPYFDNWDIPVGLIAMIVLSAAYAMACAIKLRRVSEEIRGNAVKALTERLIQCGGKHDKIELLLTEIQQLKDGAFLPWARQPWLKAMLWLLGGLGIMSAELISLGAIE